jgi:hypothetical protein
MSTKSCPRERHVSIAPWNDMDVRVINSLACGSSVVDPNIKCGNGKLIDERLPHLSYKCP